VGQGVPSAAAGHVDGDGGPVSWQPGLTKIYVISAHGYEDARVVVAYSSQKAAAKEAERLNAQPIRNSDYEVTEVDLLYD